VRIQVAIVGHWRLHSLSRYAGRGRG
jgi:hypothetical protein